MSLAHGGEADMSAKDFSRKYAIAGLGLITGPFSEGVPATAAGAAGGRRPPGARSRTPGCAVRT